MVTDMRQSAPGLQPCPGTSHEGTGPERASLRSVVTAELWAVVLRQLLGKDQSITFHGSNKNRGADQVRSQALLKDPVTVP